MTTERRPALAKMHPLHSLGGSTSGAGETPPVGNDAIATPPTPPATSGKRATEQMNIRIDSELNQRADRAMLKVAAERGARVSKRALVEEMMSEFLDRHGY